MIKISQLTTEKDRLEAAKIANKRLQERQRKDRILDTKSRIFGLDTEALNSQVEEKRRQRYAEQRQEQEFSEMERKRAEEAEQFDREESEMRRKMDEETNLFRKTSQLKESTREFDLNDKDALKKSKPPRTTDNDPWLSVSGAQKFAGEDLAHAERLKAQKEEQKMWLQRQMEEKRRNLEATKLRDKDIYAYLVANANRDHERETMNTVRRHELSRENAEYNRVLAKERHNQIISDRIAEEKDNLAEIYNHLSSDMLKENPDTAKSALGRNRKVQYMYRGMSKAEVESYRQGQLGQQQEAQRNADADKRNEQDQMKMQEAEFRREEIVQRQLNRLNKNEALDLKEENERLASLQAAEEMTRNRKDNRPTEEYFQQFNTTSR